MPHELVCWQCTPGSLPQHESIKASQCNHHETASDLNYQPPSTSMPKHHTLKHEKTRKHASIGHQTLNTIRRARTPKAKSTLHVYEGRIREGTHATPEKKNEMEQGRKDRRCATKHKTRKGRGQGGGLKDWERNTARAYSAVNSYRFVRTLEKQKLYWQY